MKLPNAGEEWVHYKGGTYTVVCIARGCDYGYYIVYKDKAGHIWSRDLYEFIGLVKTELKTEDSVVTPRFVFKGVLDDHK